MANIDAVDLPYKNVPSSHLANVVAVTGSRTLAANPTAADAIRLCKIPPGFQAYRLTIKNADLDSNGTPTLVISAGYRPVDGSAGVDNAFIAAGSTILQAASGVGGNSFFVKPVAIEKESYLVLVVGTAAATFAAGEITAVLEGIGVGVK